MHRSAAVGCRLRRPASSSAAQPQVDRQRGRDGPSPVPGSQSVQRALPVGPSPAHRRVVNRLHRGSIPATAHRQKHP